MSKRWWVPLLAVVCASACSGHRASSAEITGLPGAVPSAASSSWAPPQQMVSLTCDNVMAVLWPDSDGKPAAPGWLGPTCGEADVIALTWTYSGGAGAPEASDAAYVALCNALLDRGWQVLDSVNGESADGAEMTEELVSPEGRHAEVVYTITQDQATTLAVEFHR